MYASDRVKYLGCELSLTSIGKILGTNRQRLNDDFNSNPNLFDLKVKKANRLWVSICKKGKNA